MAHSILLASSNESKGYNGEKGHEKTDSNTKESFSIPCHQINRTKKPVTNLHLFIPIHMAISFNNLSLDELVECYMRKTIITYIS